MVKEGGKKIARASVQFPEEKKVKSDFFQSAYTVVGKVTWYPQWQEDAGT